MTNSKVLVEIGHQFYERQWMWGTSGNLSVRLKSDPLSIAVTPTGLNKGHMTTQDLLTITDGKALAKHPKGWKPSSETLIHQAIYRAVPDTTAVFHVHPIYATLISGFYGHPREPRKLKVEWFEVLKALGVGEEEIGEFYIVPNWQDVSLIARDIAEYVKSPGKTLPMVLVYNHGLTAWGRTADETRNYLEATEYICKYLYLKNLAKSVIPAKAGIHN